MSVLLLLKRLICRLGFGDRLIEFCHACGREVEQVWRAPDSLWRSITGEEEGVRCVPCFDAECYARGCLLRWRPEVAAHRAVDGDWIPTPDITEIESERAARQKSALAEDLARAVDPFAPNPKDAA